MFIKVEN